MTADAGGAEPGRDDGAEPGRGDGVEPGRDDGAEPGRGDGAEPGRDYGAEYSEESLWKKIAVFAARAGRELIEQVLVLYYCCLDPDTPVWAKTVIVGALGYFIAPIDAIPDLLPGVGFSDDLGAVVLALATVVAHVKPEHRRKAREKVKGLFGDNPER